MSLTEGEIRVQENQWKGGDRKEKRKEEAHPLEVVENWRYLFQELAGLPREVEEDLRKAEAEDHSVELQLSEDSLVRKAKGVLGGD
jgi:hypothetical protein